MPRRCLFHQVGLRNLTSNEVFGSLGFRKEFVDNQVIDLFIHHLAPWTYRFNHFLRELYGLLSGLVCPFPQRLRQADHITRVVDALRKICHGVKSIDIRLVHRVTELAQRKVLKHVSTGFEIFRCFRTLHHLETTSQQFLGLDVLHQSVCQLTGIAAFELGEQLFQRTVLHCFNEFLNVSGTDFLKYFRRHCCFQSGHLLCGLKRLEFIELFYSFQVQAANALNSISCKSLTVKELVQSTSVLVKPCTNTFCFEQVCFQLQKVLTSFLGKVRSGKNCIDAIGSSKKRSNVPG